MINIYELEKRWFKYKIKSYIPHLSIFISLVVIFVGGYLFFNTDMFESPQQEVKQIAAPIQNKPDAQTQPIVEKKVLVQPLSAQKSIQQTTTTPPKEETLSLKKTSPQPKEKTQKLLVQPSMKFIQNIQDAPAMRQIKHTSAHKKQTSYKETPKRVTHKQDTQKNSKISIQTSDAYSELKDVIRRFQKNNNPALSLFVAKKYYKLKEYNKAYNYALKTNELNNNIEASWIIFAKSLVKLHKKDKAIATLRSYIRHSNSNKAKILLNEILTGKLHAD